MLQPFCSCRARLGAPVSAQSSLPGLRPNPILVTNSPCDTRSDVRGARGGDACPGHSPWKVGRSLGSPCQHRCMRCTRLPQARGRALQTGGSSGRCPFTTFTMMCRMFFSSAKGRHTSEGRVQAGGHAAYLLHAEPESARELSAHTPGHCLYSLSSLHICSRFSGLWKPPMMQKMESVHHRADLSGH